MRIRNGLEVVIKLIVLIIFVFPFLWMISTALQTLQETSSYPPTLWPAVPQWHNFVEAMQAGPFHIYARNSVIITLSIIIIQMLIMIPAAYAFAKYNFVGKNVMFSLVLLAFMIPNQVTFIPVYLMMADWGWIRTLLPQIVPFMTNAFGIFLLRQYFKQVPEEIVEAARLDNANEFKIMWQIMMPMARPALATIALFSFVSHWNDYFWPLVMTDSTGVRPLTIGIARLRETEGVTNWNIIMAGNVVLVLPILLAYSIASRHIVRAFVYTGIK
jgi:sn-glycerol 3-phosphate transport system permease protein